MAAAKSWRTKRWRTCASMMPKWCASSTATLSWRACARDPAARSKPACGCAASMRRSCTPAAARSCAWRSPRARRCNGCSSRAASSFLTSGATNIQDASTPTWRPAPPTTSRRRCSRRLRPRLRRRAARELVQKLRTEDGRGGRIAVAAPRFLSVVCHLCVCRPSSVYRITTTGVPTPTRPNKSVTSSLNMRMQPWETKWPIEDG